MGKHQLPDEIINLKKDISVPPSFFKGQENATTCTYLATCSEEQFLFVEKSLEEVLGYDPSFLATKGLNWWFSLIHPEDSGKMLNTIFQHCFLQPAEKRVQKPFSQEYRMRHQNNDWIWIKETKCVVTVTEANMNDLILGRIENIMERKVKEQQQLNRILRKHGQTNTFLKAAIPMLERKEVSNRSFRGNEVDFPRPRGMVMPTKRELEILHLIGEGFSTKEIAEKLFISINTVETHRRHLLEKINVKNSMELIKQTSNAYWLKAI